MTNREDSNGAGSPIRTIALVVVFLGALGSLFFTVYQGRHNSSKLLIFLFAGWVLSPFVALLVANAMARRWFSQARNLLHWFMLLITPFSLIFYSHWVVPAGVKPAFVFLIVPLASWLVMAIGFLVTRLWSGPAGKK